MTRGRGNLECPLVQRFPTVTKGFPSPTRNPLVATSFIGTYRWGMQKSTKQLVVVINASEANFRVPIAITQPRTESRLRRAIGGARSVQDGAPSKRVSRVIVLTRLLSLVLLLALSAPLSGLAVGSSSVSVAWDRNAEADVTSYRIYYGLASRQYSSSINAGNVTAVVVPGLSTGVPYFFAVTALDATGLESDYSSEVVVAPSGGFTLNVRIPANRQSILTVAGPASRSYDLLATTNLTTWTTLGSATAGANGLATYTDTGASGHQVRYYRARQKP